MNSQEKIHNLKYLKKYRRELRHNLTSAEALLWRMLQRSQLHGRKFRRQHSIGKYIVDFYCPQEKLIVELDGQAHHNSFAEHYDEERDRYLTKSGFRILRFENDEVIKNLEGVLERIAENFSNSPPLTPPQRGGEN